MSAHVLASEGVNLVKANKYNEGIEKLTQALKSQKAPMWLIERSKAYLRTNDFQLALHDAEQALSIAYDRANRDLMIEAQIRRAVTLFRLKQYADTDVCAYWALKLLDGAKASEDHGIQNRVDERGDYAVTLAEAQELNAKDVQAKKEAGLQSAMASGRSKDSTNRNLAFSWRINALQAMEKLEAGASGRKVTVVQYPKPSDTPAVATKKVQSERITEIEDDDHDEPEEEQNKPKIPQHILTGEAPREIVPWTWDDVWNQFQAEHRKHDIRTDWYETDTTANVSLFVKNLPKDSVKVDSREQSVTVSPIAIIPTGSFTLDLQGKIKPEETTYTVKSMKVELVLKKEVPGKWRVLRNSDADVKFRERSSFVAHAENLGFEPTAFQTDASNGDLDAWYDNIYTKLFSNTTSDSTATSASQAKKVDEPSAAQPTPEAKPSGPAYPTSSKSGPKNWEKMDVDDEDEDEANVDDFFKKLYKDADPDTRRAMMKSYIESNGTSLSTSWSEASKKNYKTEPPEGAEAKKWDE
ncbi:SGS domain-containing protein [Truncatella angustata]|uniref:SGS domain-containing protein n=1 Tax=Truncatella angustata TaxID=152316 RepID=A0A9P8UHX4_9PEZI|nr:SGS domain-containing protein [Truncatella angustata]KAH6652540.1 SGS domain-containing protein [Truncatella angustata]KAH8200156.1 hypothetical protein TruAng_005668 [Truncatella angustata]